ncbi:hypothetical protein CUP0520 [Campylobacter upsaliensis RM3195]|nr:hypothetical protein [Campylobacter upsaliensis]EAL53376.1 hypothetical protein CUP0520 [Campylobacter upsaliensis RM3195]MCR2104387.1 hypothetical protein [Campylobacter upsaliensis]
MSVYSIFSINEYIGAINGYFDLWKNLKTIKNQINSISAFINF